MKFIFLVLLILSTPVLAKRTYSEHDGMSKPKDEVCKGIREKKITSCRNEWFKNKKGKDGDEKTHHATASGKIT